MICEHVYNLHRLYTLTKKEKQPYRDSERVGGSYIYIYTHTHIYT